MGFCLAVLLTELNGEITIVNVTCSKPFAQSNATFKQCVVLCRQVIVNKYCAEQLYFEITQPLLMTFSFVTFYSNDGMIELQSLVSK